MRPVVSAVIATHNRAELVREALDSVYGQEGLGDLFDLEVVVVDDASSDHTPNVVARYPAIYIRHDRNQGVAAALNTAMGASHGAYIGFLGDDDLWLPSRLRMQVPILEASPDVGLVYGACIARDPDRKEEVWPGGPSGWIFPQLLRGEGFQAATVLVRRAALDVCGGGFDETMPDSVLEDLELWLRIAHRFRVECVPEPVGVYNYAAGRFQRRLTDGSLLRDYQRLADKVASYEPRAAVSARRGMQTAWINAVFHFLPDPEALETALDALTTHSHLARNPAIVQIVSVHILQLVLADASPVAYAARITKGMPRSVQGALWAHLAISLVKRRALPSALYATARAARADATAALRTAHTRMRLLPSQRAV